MQTVLCVPEDSPQSNYWALVCVPPILHFPLWSTRTLSPHTEAQTDTPFGSQHRIPFNHYLRHPSTVGSWRMRISPPWIQPPMDLYKLTTLPLPAHLVGIFIHPVFIIIIIGCCGSLLLRTGFLLFQRMGFPHFAVRGLLIVGAPLVYRFSGAWAVVHVGSVLWQHELSCPTECGLFPNQGSNLWSPALVGGLLATGPQRSPTTWF